MAMAYVEAAAVLYLRTLYGGVDPIGPRLAPFQPVPAFDTIEIGREAATMVMLACVGWLAGPAGARFGAFIVAFGTWDIFYYVFLWLFTGWPGSLAPDILFLIPLPWWGPVVSPGLIAAIMVFGGGLAMARAMGDGLPRMTRSAWLLLGAGVVLCLAAFMAGSLLALPRGLQAALEVRNPEFPWPLYGAGLAAVAAGIGRLLSADRPQEASSCGPSKP